MTKPEQHTTEPCRSRCEFTLTTQGKLYRVFGTCIHHGQWAGEIMVKDGRDVIAILGPHGIVCRVDVPQPDC